MCCKKDIMDYPTVFIIMQVCWAVFIIATWIRVGIYIWTTPISQFFK